MKAEKGADRHIGSGQEAAKQRSAYPRSHVGYWQDRIYHKTFTRDGTSHSIAEWSVRLQHLSRREAFALNTTNAAVAAVKAKEIDTFLQANGWEQTLAKFKPDPIAKAAVCTLGEFLAEVGKRSHLKAITVRRYATKIRKIVSDVSGAEAGQSRKDKRRKFDYFTGGRDEWKRKVDGQPLSILAPDVISEWRNRYVAKAGTNSLKRKSAERSAASILRNARALFSEEVLPLLKVKLPPNPFARVKLKDPGPQRYQSQVNPAWLLGCAERELRVAEPNQFLALFLCLWGGLRRKEADFLTWAQVDFPNRQIKIKNTEHFSTKSDESARDVDLSEVAMDVLREFQQGHKGGEFVLTGNEPRPKATYEYYRCDYTWRNLIAWMRGKGITTRTANHMLRKESGSLIAMQFGIEEARRHLGHRDIRTTSAHYVGKKKRVEVSLPSPATASELRVIA